jgi:hypothetical protein
MTHRDKLTKEALLQALEVIDDGIAIYDDEENPLLLNRVTWERFGEVYDNIVHKGISYRDAIAASVEKARPDLSPEEQAKATDYFYKFTKSSESYVSPTDNGGFARVYFRKMPNGMTAAISVDVTEELAREKELKKARAAAEAASQAKSAFLANMSHEIRTPLNGIMGMAQVLVAADLDPVHRERVNTILESSKTLTALLNDVLDLSKIEAGKFDIAPTDTDVAHVLRRIWKLWRPRAEEKGVELTLALDCELPSHLHVDSVRMQQCVSNLVSNAIKFTAAGRVTIFARAKPREDGQYLLEIEVSDTGCGMDEETLSRLFQPFVQADATTQRRHGGTGLGLSITRRLAELMGGAAGAVSTPGQGSTFTVSFIAAPPSAPIERRGRREDEVPEAAVAALKASNLRVLLVDDHPVNRQVAALFLAPLNMRIVEATNGKEALEALGRQEFDVILLDMHMPVMDGPTTIRHIRQSGQAWSSTPVIALTADAMSGDKERYLGMGMDGYISKPLAERDLLSEIARVRTKAAAAA